MRTGAHSVQQALTAEAALVLKQSLSLARRRGHAQVTPLHVAATLLSSSSPSFRDTPNLLRRACLKSHPHHPSSHPLQCRALELCFNVALNRLPTTPPPSSGPLTHSLPSLSNALIAALKRAQAHQRRGSIEQQQQQLQNQQQQQQQQQPLLAIKVELEQLIISILDDPSVSRVMREAGFSSTCVKANIEEDSCASPSAFFFDSQREITNQGIFFNAHLLKPSAEKCLASESSSSQKEDLKVVLEVMLRKQGRRSSTVVVVGDSVASTEGIVNELMRRVERGEVPHELKSCHLIRFQLSPLHLRLMSRSEIEKKVSELRTKMAFSGGGGGGAGSGPGGVIVYVGDLKLVVDEELEVPGSAGFKPVEHLVAELGKLLLEARSFDGNSGGLNTTTKVWLMATASYQTYMKCQMRQPSLESQWGLQAVVVPSGGLALSLQAPSSVDSKVPKLSQCPFQVLESKAFNLKEEQDKLACCVECTLNYEKEASMSKPHNSSGSTNMPSWLQPHKQEFDHKDSMIELKRKWSRLCQTLHHNRHNQTQVYSPFLNQSLVCKDYGYASSNPWWPNNSLPYYQNRISMDPLYNFSGTRNQSEGSLHSLKKNANQDVRISLALGSPLTSDSATSKDMQKVAMDDQRELLQRLEDNIPWHSKTIPSIMDALLDCRSSEKKRGTWLLLEGNDQIAKRRLARVAAEWFSGSNCGTLIHINTRNKSTVAEALLKDPKSVFFIEDIDRMHANLTRSLAEGLKNGFIENSNGRKITLANAVFITIAGNTEFEDSDRSYENVLEMRLCSEEMTPHKHKRKAELELQKDSKKAKIAEGELDLNVCAEDELDVPSDLTQETESEDLNLPHRLIASVCSRITLNPSPYRDHQVAENLMLKLRHAFEEVHGVQEGAGELLADRAVAEGLKEVCGSFTEQVFDEWLKEVFQTSLLAVKKGGKVRLCLDGKEGGLVGFGFKGSCLPNRIHVD